MCMCVEADLAPVPDHHRGPAHPGPPLALRGLRPAPRGPRCAGEHPPHPPPPRALPGPGGVPPRAVLGPQVLPFEYLPFGGGHRRCIGAAFAQYEMKVVLAYALAATARAAGRRGAPRGAPQPHLGSRGRGVGAHDRGPPTWAGARIALMSGRERQTSTYPGQALEIVYDRTLCVHVGECGRSKVGLFDAKKDPWCTPDAVALDVAVDVVQRCPPGRSPTPARTAAPRRPPRREHRATSPRTAPTTSPASSRSTARTGAARPLRAALCRCGASKNKPFCAGPTSRRASRTPVRSANAGMARRRGRQVHGQARPERTAARVRAPAIRAATGRVAFKGTKAALCRCGSPRTSLSATAPTARWVSRRSRGLGAPGNLQGDQHLVHDLLRHQVIARGVEVPGPAQREQGQRVRGGPAPCAAGRAP